MHDTSTGTRDEVAAAVPERAVDLSFALVELSGLLLDSDSLEQTLQRVVDLAVRTMPGCTGASVTLVDGERPVTAAQTDDVALAVDAAQYDVGDGPCLDAARRRRRNSVDLRAAKQEFRSSPRAPGGTAYGASSPRR